MYFIIAIFLEKRQLGYRDMHRFGPTMIRWFRVRVYMNSVRKIIFQSKRNSETGGSGRGEGAIRIAIDMFKRGIAFTSLGRFSARHTNLLYILQLNR